MSASGRKSFAEALEAYGLRAHERHLAPLWEFFDEWFGPQPRVDARPQLWCYHDLRPLLLEAGSVVTPEQAERRVLALENAGVPGGRLATNSLYAGLQLILPGEIARSHRHTSAALRFVIEGTGAYTAVDGEKAYMSAGDLIVTPPWAWHEHGNEGNGPTVWMDVLDVALLRFLGAGFSERYPEREHPTRRRPQDSLYRYAMNMLPVGHRNDSTASPVVSYPYARSREVLERLASNGPLDPHHAVKMEYIDPTSGGPAMATISTYLQLVPGGFATKPQRSTAGALYSVVEGRGTARISRDDAATELVYGPRDIWAVPSWCSLQIKAAEDTYVFSASDACVQRTLGILREEGLD